MNTIPRKRIWKGDKVRVIGGQHDGTEGLVEKRLPVNAPAKYVWIRQARQENGRRGLLVKVSCRFVVIVEKQKDDQHDRYRNRSEEGRLRRAKAKTQTSS